MQLIHTARWSSWEVFSGFSPVDETAEAHLLGSLRMGLRLNGEGNVVWNGDNNML